MTYNPLVASQLDNLEESWGEAERNRDNMIRTGIKALDQLIYGIDSRGELIIIQGKEKDRKTTFVTNWIVSMALDTNNRKKNIIIDTLESQMDFMRYRDTMIAMLMTKQLVDSSEHNYKGCPICHGDCQILGKLSPEFFRYRRDKIDGKASDDFEKALEYAKYILRQTNIAIYDGRIGQGNTRDLTGSKERWAKLHGEGMLDLLVIDHSQQYSIPGISAGDHFTHLNTVVEAVSTAITQYGFPVVLLSQVSRGSTKGTQSPAEYLASGGAKGSQEAAVVITTNKTSNSSFVATVGTSRVSGTAKIQFSKVDPPSGWIIDKDAKLESI